MLIYRYRKGVGCVSGALPQAAGSGASPQAVRNEESGAAPARDGCRSWLRLAAAIAALPLAFLVTAGQARADAGPAAAVTGTRATLTAVAAIPGSTGTWAVGESCPKAPEGCQPGKDLVLRESGGAWSPVAAPSPGGPASLVAVSADSSSDAWAVGSYDGGEKNLYLHWTGGSWQRVTGPGNSTLTGVAAISPTDALAVGYGTSSTGATVTLALHWDGTSWAKVRTPDPGGAGDDELLGVAAIPGNTGAWAVGYSLDRASTTKTLVLHWTGGAWSQARVPSVATLGTQLSAVTAVSRTDAWAVGQYDTPGNFDHPLILHWNGTAWSRPKLPPLGRNVYVLHGVAAAGSQMWAVGVGPCVGPSVNCPSKVLTMHLTSAGLRVVTGVSISSKQNQNSLNGVALTSAGTAWAVGGYFPAAYGEPVFALLEQQKGTGWVTK